MKADGTALLLAVVEPVRWQRRLAFVVGAFVLVVFVAAVAFGAAPLPQLHPAIPSLVALCVLSDLITAILLFAQFSILRSRALLVLACGYLFAAWIMVPVGAGLETASWLPLIQHLVFPAAVLGYTFLKDGSRTVEADSAAICIGWSVAIVSFVACALIWRGLMAGGTAPSLLVSYLGLALAVFNAIVFVCLLMRRRTLLDQWLLVAVLAFVLETVLANVLNTTRLSAGFHAGILLLLISSIAVMGAQLTETARLYARNMTYLDALQRERNNKLINLEAMAASIAHEVKQPLTAIRGNSDAAISFLGRDPPDLRSAAEALGDIDGDVQRTSEVFSGIANLFGRADQDRGPVDLNHIAATALRALRNEMAESGVKARVNLTADPLPVMGHGGQLLEVLSSIVADAIEAMKTVEGGARLLTVETRTDVARGLAVLIVQHTGLDTTRGTGLGLGLPMCRKILELHGGEISARLTGNQPGAVLRLTLPLTQQVM